MLVENGTNTNKWSTMKTYVLTFHAKVKIDLSYNSALDKAWFDSKIQNFEISQIKVINDKLNKREEAYKKIQEVYGEDEEDQEYQEIQ